MRNLILLLVLSTLLNCGTETGNPFMPETSLSGNTGSKLELIITQVCNKLSTCFSSTLTSSICNKVILIQNNFDTEFGLTDNIYADLTAMITAVNDMKISPNEKTSSQCLVDVKNLNCTDTEVINSYDVNDPLNYTSLYLIIPSGSGSCDDIF